MEYIPVPNCAQLEFIYDWGGQRCMNVLHYVKETPWNAASLLELCQETGALWTATFPTRLPATLLLVTIKATDLASETGPVVNHQAGLPIAGSSVSPSLPNNVALVITKRTAQRGRSFRGRIFHPGLTEAAVVGNQVPPASVTDLVNIWSSLLTIDLPISLEDAVMVVVSRFAEGQPRVTGVTTFVTNLTSDGTVDSQRRRLPGRGG